MAEATKAGGHCPRQDPIVTRAARLEAWEEGILSNWVEVAIGGTGYPKVLPAGEDELHSRGPIKIAHLTPVACDDN